MSFLCRVQEEHPVSAAAQAAGVVRDAVLRRLGTAHHVRLLPQPFRVVGIATGKMQKNGAHEVRLLVTNRLELDAELLALAYRYRWAVEIALRDANAFARVWAKSSVANGNASLGRIRCGWSWPLPARCGALPTWIAARRDRGAVTGPGTDRKRHPVNSTSRRPVGRRSMRLAFFPYHHSPQNWPKMPRSPNMLYLSQHRARN